MTATSENASAAATSLGAMAGKYLTFILGGESYAIPVLKVREIIRLTSITAVPQMPTHVRGVINLRGKIIPVQDLRMRFGFPEAGNTDQTCIVVVQVRTGDGQSTAMGLIVDGVEEVTQIAAGDIEETPDFGTQVSNDYLMGMAKLKGAVKALLDIDQVIAADGAVSLQRIAGSAPLVPACA